MGNLIEFKEELKNELVPTAISDSVFEIKTANQFIADAKNRPIPRMLFGELWFEGEICILFADTNLGKSILAVQICNSISTGVSTCGLKLECPPLKIIYFDFELSDKQFENRYSENYENHHVFSDNFLRAEIDPNYHDDNRFSSFEEYLNYSLEKSILEFNVKILAIDNITYLKQDNERAKDAQSLMKILKDLKNKYDLSILVLAHTPKIDPCKPISKNHLSGSKMLMNFADSSFAIGESHQENGLRYIKQIKVRSCEHLYGSDNVIVYAIEKNASFLQFVFICFDVEYEHLKPQTTEAINERNENIIELFKQGLSKSEIARQINLSEGAIRKILRNKNL
uniref:AAA family ATPase n=1 Tax=Flavobacterium sp. TaxID=239 RepID=UPI00404BA212